MKFGNRLREQAEPGWRYVDYNRLKLWLKDLVEQRRQRERGASGQGDGDGGLPSSVAASSATVSSAPPEVGATAASAGSPSETSGQLKQPFVAMVVSELRAVEEFLGSRLSEARARFEALQEEQWVVSEWVESGYPDVEAHLVSLLRGLGELGAEAARLLLFVDLNVTAVRKIFKKYNHVTGHHAGPGMILSDDAGSMLDRLSEPAEVSVLAANVQAALEQALEMRRRFGEQASQRRLLGKRPLAADARSESATDSGGDAAAAASRRRDRAVQQRDWEREEHSLPFESFLARQLLVSRRLFGPSDAPPQQPRGRERRRPGSARAPARAPARAGAEAGSKRAGSDSDSDSESAPSWGDNLDSSDPEWQSRERRRKSRRNRARARVAAEELAADGNVLDPRYTGLSLHATALMTLASMYAGNVASLAPLNELYAEASRTETASAALGLALMALFSWVAMLCLLELARSSPSVLSPVAVAVAAAVAGNVAYAKAFSGSGAAVGATGGTTGSGGTTSPSVEWLPGDLALHSRDNELTLVVGFALLGAGGWLALVAPVMLCALPAVNAIEQGGVRHFGSGAGSSTSSSNSRARKGETLAAGLAVSPMLGALFGRGVSTVGWSWNYAEQDEDSSVGGGGNWGGRMVVEFNGLSFPALFYIMLWSCVLMLLVGTPFTSALARAAQRLTPPDSAAPAIAGASPAPRRGKQQDLVADVEPPAWAASGFATEGLPHSEHPVGMPWGSALLVQVCTAFSQRLVAVLLSLVLTSVFLESWAVVAVAGLLLAALPLPLLWIAWRVVRHLGAWAALRVSVCLSALVACFLLPLQGISYSELWFAALMMTLYAVSTLTQTVAMTASVKALETRPDLAPLEQFGMLGPIVAVQSSRWAGDALAFGLVAAAYSAAHADLTFLLNLAFSSIALLQTACFVSLVFFEGGKK
jgi:hypothetical protein